jgi:hypothetical protein
MKGNKRKKLHRCVDDEAAEGTEEEPDGLLTHDGSNRRKPATRVVKDKPYCVYNRCTIDEVMTIQLPEGERTEERRTVVTKFDQWSFTTLCVLFT